MSATATPVRKDKSFTQEVYAETASGERLRHCLQCGTCGGSCPNGAEMDHTPRDIFAMIAAGEREKVLSANTMWVCVSCYLCTSRCPQEIPITDIMYTLKRMAIREHLAKDSNATALARTFTGLVEKYGRSFEFGLASRYYLTNKPLSLLKMGPLGVSMYTRGRVALAPTRIKNIRQLQAIINKAKKLGKSK